MECVNNGVDKFIYVESDLIWQPETMLRLIRDLDTYPAVAGMCFQRGRHYDTWGLRGLDGRSFGDWEPYYASFTNERLFEIYSAGSVLAMLEQSPRSRRFKPENHMVGLCENIRRTHKPYLAPPRPSWNTLDRRATRAISRMNMLF